LSGSPVRFSCRFDFRNMHAPPNSLPPVPDSSLPGAGSLTAISGTPSPAENPAWTGWDVAGLAVLTVVSSVSFLFASAYFAHRAIYPKLPWIDVARLPELVVLSQLMAYFVVIAWMYVLVRRAEGSRFWQAVRWNWPGNWPLYLLSGAVLALALQGFARLLPIPKNMPIDRFFQTAREAWLLSLFGVTFAPLLEELFFRGFLYPVLARRLGMAAGVFFTALGFGLIHAAQLSNAWAPVLVIVLVGIVLTLVRALTKSLATSLLIHIGYNGTISALILVATGGFRHLEKLGH